MYTFENKTLNKILVLLTEEIIDDRKDLENVDDSREVFTAMKKLKQTYSVAVDLRDETAKTVEQYKTAWHNLNNQISKLEKEWD